MTDTATETPQRTRYTSRDVIEAYKRAVDNQHEERMARATAPPQPSYEIARKSPAGKTSGFEFTITHPDPDEAAKLAKKWDEEFPAPQPVVKP